MSSKLDEEGLLQYELDLSKSEQGSVHGVKSEQELDSYIQHGVEVVREQEGVEVFREQERERSASFLADLLEVSQCNVDKVAKQKEEERAKEAGRARAAHNKEVAEALQAKSQKERKAWTELNDTLAKMEKMFS